MPRAEFERMMFELKRQIDALEELDLSLSLDAIAFSQPPSQSRFRGPKSPKRLEGIHKCNKIRQCKQRRKNHGVAPMRLNFTNA